jgi:hypothetical protein
MNIVLLTLCLATSPADVPKPATPKSTEVREDALKLADGGVRIPPRGAAVVADGGVRIPPRKATAVADGGVRIPPRGAAVVADGGVRIPPRA